MHSITNIPAFRDGVATVLNGVASKPISPAAYLTIQKLLMAGSHWSTGWMAYGLATAWHEAKFIPRDEIGKGRGRAYGKPGVHGGQVPYGRGLVQITWDYNYEWADAALAAAGLIQKGDLLRNFSLANDPTFATFILVKGMEEGQFTKGGRKLSKYIGERGDEASFTQARRIINSQDRAVLIAGYAMGFQSALDAGGW